MLLGRRAECEAVERRIARARDGHSEAVVVRGEAGIGKTAPPASSAEETPWAWLENAAPG